MIQVTPLQKILGTAASLLGITQGISWFVMSLLCIIEYILDTPPEFSSTYMGRFDERVYYFYLYKSSTPADGTIVTPTAFVVFMSLYILLTTAWVVASCFQLNVVRKPTVNLPVVFKDWAIITCLISVVDFVLVLLIGVDYNQQCIGSSNEDACTNTLIPVMVLAARGFILWFVNVVIAWMLIKIADFMRKDNVVYQNTFGGIFPVYETYGHIPRANVSTNPSLYSQQVSMVASEKGYWNVNLRQAMEKRTPVTSRPPSSRNEFFMGPRSPRTPSSRSDSLYSPRTPNSPREFFAKY